MAQLACGDFVAQRYRIERLLGVGGMGSVYEATETATHKRWALKVLHPQFLHHPVIPQRFLQEAMAARALTTPHAVKVDGTGTTDDGCPFIVMEFLDGVDLGHAMRLAGGRLESDRALALMDQAAEALQEAHARGIIHRDLKPDNVFVIATPAGEMVKVVDFGISKILTREDGIKLTQTGTTLGTPHYMPLEQLRGAKDLDGRVDVYALGVILYEVLAGVRPFDGFTYEEVILKVATSTPRPLAEVRPDLPAGLVEVIERAMARERDQRIPTMLDLRTALAPYRASGAGKVPSVPPVSGGRSQSYGPPERFSQSQGCPATASMPGNYARASSAVPPKPKKNGVLIAVIVASLLLITVGVLFAAGGAGAWFYLSGSSEPGEAAATPARSAAPSMGRPTSSQAKPPGKR